MTAPSDYGCVPVPGGWHAFRTYQDKCGDVCFEWFTRRGWRRVAGGSHDGRKPRDVLTFRIHQPSEGSA